MSRARRCRTARPCPARRAGRGCRAAGRRGQPEEAVAVPDDHQVAAEPVGTGVGLLQGRAEPDHLQPAQVAHARGAPDEAVQPGRALGRELPSDACRVDGQGVTVDHGVEPTDRDGHRGVRSAAGHCFAGVGGSRRGGDGQPVAGPEVGRRGWTDRLHRRARGGRGSGARDGRCGRARGRTRAAGAPGQDEQRGDQRGDQPAGVRGPAHDPTPTPESITATLTPAPVEEPQAHSRGDPGSGSEPVDPARCR